MKSFFGTLMLILMSAAVMAADLFPVETMADGKATTYTPITRVTKQWRICVLIPNAIDKFWWGVGWAVNESAMKLNLKLGVYNAGGYDGLETQREQFNNCRAGKADAIILATVNPAGLNQEINGAMADGVVIVDMINKVDGVKTTASSVANAGELGKLATSYLIRHAAKRSVTVIWFPGPKDADWVKAVEQSTIPALNQPTIKFVHGGYGLPDIKNQVTLFRATITKVTPDYILANAPAAEAAARLLKYGKPMKFKVISYYANGPVFEFIRSGEILAAASNSPVIQAHIALDLAIRALEHKNHPKVVNVISEMIDASNIESYNANKVYAPPNTWVGIKKLPD